MEYSEGKNWRPLRILTIDDDPSTRSLLWEAMSSEGHEMQFAKDGEEVFQQLSKANFDLLILDVNMPKLNGYQVSQKITSGFPERPRILIYTGRSVEEERGLFLLSGADAILQKDAGIDEFRAKVYELTGITSKTPQGEGGFARPAAEKRMEQPGPAQTRFPKKDKTGKDIESMKEKIRKIEEDISFVLTRQKSSLEKTTEKINAHQAAISKLASELPETGKEIRAIRKQMNRFHFLGVLVIMCLAAALCLMLW